MRVELTECIPEISFSLGPKLEGEGWIVSIAVGGKLSFLLTEEFLEVWFPSPFRLRDILSPSLPKKERALGVSWLRSSQTLLLSYGSPEALETIRDYGEGEETEEPTGV